MLDTAIKLIIANQSRKIRELEGKIKSIEMAAASSKISDQFKYLIYLIFIKIKVWGK